MFKMIYDFFEHKYPDFRGRPGMSILMGPTGFLWSSFTADFPVPKSPNFKNIFSLFSFRYSKHRMSHFFHGMTHHFHIAHLKIFPFQVSIRQVRKTDENEFKSRLFEKIFRTREEEKEEKSKIKRLF